MEQLLASRMSPQKQTPLENLSPQKYGKAAFASLGYTPSRLADNVLYRESVNQKKAEDGLMRVREGEALSSMLRDRLKQTEQERDGIEQALGQQLAMYKRMLHDNELQHEARVKDLQQGFGAQLQDLIQRRDEEVRYTQAERELLENRIDQLQHCIADLRGNLKGEEDKYDQLHNEHDKTLIHLAHLTQMLKDSEEKAIADMAKENEKFEQYKIVVKRNQDQFKDRIQKIENDKKKEKQTLQKTHKENMERAERQRCRDLQEKSEEFKQIVNKFESEASRLNTMITTKDKQIQSLNLEVTDERHRLSETKRLYEVEISSLSHQLGHCRQELEEVWKQKIGLEQAIKASQSKNSIEVSNLEAYIERLRKELQKMQTASNYEQNRHCMQIEDLQRQLAQQRVDRQDIAAFKGQNTTLAKEIRTLKELLVESSMQMETCKGEFLRIGREKDQLLFRLNEMIGQNEILQRMKIQKEDEARGWRDNYYQRR